VRLASSGQYEDEALAERFGSEQMRILYHHRTLGDGAEGIHVAEMVKAFRRLGHEVRVVSLIGESTNVQSRPQQQWGLVKKLLPGFLYEMGELSYNIQGYISVAKAVKEFRPDFIYDRYISYNYSAVAVGRRHKIPVVLEVNSPYSHQKQTFDEKVYYKTLLRCFEKNICSDATCVIVVSTPLKDFLISTGVPEDKIVVMPNGVDTEVFHPGIDRQEVRQRLGIEQETVIGFTGILRPWHGLEVLLQAFQQICQTQSDLHLLIVGDGPIRSDLEKAVANNGLSGKVTITGRQVHELVRSFVAAMDIAVSPRTTFYASPMKILEYMAMGKAVIAPDTENCRDILADQREGILFRPEDADDLARKLRRLIDDSDLRSKLGNAARTKIESGHTWLDNARSVIGLVEGNLHVR
jgi:glycosyltransferase involved in cell wall biosynthesis